MKKIVVFSLILVATSLFGGTNQERLRQEQEKFTKIRNNSMVGAREIFRNQVLVTREGKDYKAMQDKLSSSNCPWLYDTPECRQLVQDRNNAEVNLHNTREFKEKYKPMQRQLDHATLWLRAIEEMMSASKRFNYGKMKGFDSEFSSEKEALLDSVDQLEVFLKRHPGIYKLSTLIDGGCKEVFCDDAVEAMHKEFRDFINKNISDE